MTGGGSEGEVRQYCGVLEGGGTGKSERSEQTPPSSVRPNARHWVKQEGKYRHANVAIVMWNIAAAAGARRAERYES